MAIAFYLASLVAIVATIRVITNASPVHALLYMVISLLAVAMIFFCLGAPFAGALEIIVYAGAIMILFVFAVMMLNLGEETRAAGKALAYTAHLGRARVCWRQFCLVNWPGLYGRMIRAVAARLLVPALSTPNRSGYRCLDRIYCW